MKAGEFQIVLSLQIRSDFLHVKMEVKLKEGVQERSWGGAESFQALFFHHKKKEKKKREGHVFPFVSCI